MKAKMMCGIACAAFAALALSTHDASAACNDNKDRTITVINNSSRVVESVHATNTRNNSYGSDILPGTIDPGDQVTVNADDGSCRCMMDFKATGPRNVTWKRTMNVCDRSSWTLSD